MSQIVTANSVSVRKQLLTQYYSMLSKGTGTASDALNYSHALEILETSGDFETALVDLANQFKTNIEQRYTAKFDEKLASIASLSRGNFVFPKIFSSSASENRLIELDQNTFIFLTGKVASGFCSLSVYMTTDRGVSWKRELNYRVSTSDTKAFTHINAIDFGKDSAGNLFMTWLKDKYIYIGSVVNGSIVAPFQVTDNTNNKSASVRMGINSDNDIAIFYSEEISSLYQARVVTKLANSSTWTAMSIYTKSGYNNNHDLISSGRVLSFNNRFYAVFDTGSTGNNTNTSNNGQFRTVVIELRKNSSGSFSTTSESIRIVENLGKSLGGDTTYSSLPVSTDCYLFAFTSASSKKYLGIFGKTSPYLFVIEVEDTSLGSMTAKSQIPTGIHESAYSSSSPYAIIPDGTFITGDACTSDFGNIWFPGQNVSGAEKRATMNCESSTVYLTNQSVNSNMESVYFIDLLHSVEKQAVYRGL